MIGHSNKLMQVFKQGRNISYQPGSGYIMYVTVVTGVHSYGYITIPTYQQS